MISRWLAQRLDCTEGQVYTLCIAAALAVLVTAGGVIPASHGLDPALASGAGAPEALQPLAGPPAPAPNPTLMPIQPVRLPTLSPQLGVLPLPLLPPATGEPVSPVQSAPAEPADRGAPPPPAPAQGVALVITIAAWYTADSGTPLATADTPEGTLPVRARAGSADAISVIRLSIDSGPRVLELMPVSADPLAATAGVRLCPLTPGSTWKPAPAQPIADVPKYDCTRGSDGKKVSSGAWRFVIAATAPTDFALVPTGTPGQTFRLNFDPKNTA